MKTPLKLGATFNVPDLVLDYDILLTDCLDLYDHVLIEMREEHKMMSDSLMCLFFILSIDTTRRDNLMSQIIELRKEAISPFMKAGRVEDAMHLAARHLDFTTIITICESLGL